MEATPPAAKPAVVLSGLRKEFPDTPPVVAVDDIDLEIHDGEFFSMLGPSGSGKTTALRMIAGFETPTSGRVELGGQNVTKIQPYDRDVNTVF
jgi:putative spermidine/putrescine transport system ATP-binding protein